MFSRDEYNNPASRWAFIEERNKAFGEALAAHEAVRNPLNEIEEHAKALLESLPAWGDVPEDHRADTPKRFAKMLLEMTTREDFKFTCFPSQDNNMVSEGPIPFYTFCAHHIVPFHGHAYVSYVPNGKVAGLSKLPRSVVYMAKGFWVQEDLTTAIADYIEQMLNPLGVAVVLEAEHMCMAMRGLKMPDVITTTAAMRGVYGDHTRTAKAEFMEVVNARRPK